MIRLGTGLAGIVAGLAGAEEVVISDYPAMSVLANIRRNVQRNIAHGTRDAIKVMGHEWGVLEDEFAQNHGGRYKCVIAADCFWMPLQHRNLVRSMLHFLSMSVDARVFAIGGFHTGRAILASFFTTAQEEGLILEKIHEEDDKGLRRAWQAERDGGREDVTERKKWLCVATLVKATNVQQQPPPQAT
jgi:nicotinamide N-methyltransferase